MSGRPPSVTLIDDDESMSQALTRLLTVSGFTVQRYFSAEACLDAWPTTSAPDFLVVDIGLPGISGIKLVEHLRTRCNDKTPVAFISAYDEPETREQALKAGAVIFLTKPFPGHSLIAALRTAERQ
ncbi:MAG TPA: response regulator [Candidatus Methylacidiphilales bacterium]|nr:response regulator [Candidatus Methylacidiphilales bacterium]